MIKPYGLRIPYALAVHGEEEKRAVLEVLDEHRTNIGRETTKFEKKVASLFGKKYGVMVNSGSSANLLAVELLNLEEGAEVITPILTFSTTVAPLIKHHLVPVFVDVEPGKYTIAIESIEKMITKKTKAILIPLLLGNVPDMQKLSKIAKKYNLFFIEDSCDTLGATFKKVPTGAYSNITTTSFFGSHIITAGGNGGMILVNRSKWKDRAKMLRGWGRSSSLLNESEDISKRFKTKIDSIQYDAKFIFEDIGYNFLPCEMGAAFGNAQLEKLTVFRKKREGNFTKLFIFFRNYEKYFILPKQDSFVKTQWLAFPLTIRENAPFSRYEITTYLEKNNVQTRPIFTGNILKQPAFKNVFHGYRSNNFPVADQIMKSGFLIGCHHGLRNEQIKRLKELFNIFLQKYS